MTLRTILLATALACALAGCTPVDEKAQKEADELWIQEHGNDAKAMDERFGSKAGIACAVKVDDYLRSIAQYDFAWDDDAKGYSDKFTKYALQSTGVGMMTQVSDKAKLSNGFGAFEHVTIYCLYNAATDEVVRFSTSNPYLDTLIPAEDDDNHSTADNSAESLNYDANIAANAADPSATSDELQAEPEPQPANAGDGTGAL